MLYLDNFKQKNDDYAVSRSKLNQTEPQIELANIVLIRTKTSKFAQNKFSLKLIIKT